MDHMTSDGSQKSRPQKINKEVQIPISELAIREIFASISNIVVVKCSPFSPIDAIIYVQQ